MTRNYFFTVLGIVAVGALGLLAYGQVPHSIHPAPSATSTPQATSSSIRSAVPIRAHPISTQLSQPAGTQQEVTPPPLPQASAASIDTSDWLTYTNGEFGFTLRYPRGAEIEKGKTYVTIFLEQYLGVPQELWRDREDYLTSGALFVEIMPSKADNPEHLSPREIVHKDYQESAARGWPIPTPGFEGDRVFKGEKAYYTENMFESYFTIYSIYFTHNNDTWYWIRGIKPPITPSAEWEKDPYYHYLEQSAPIFEAITSSPHVHELTVH